MTDQRRINSFHPRGFTLVETLVAIAVLMIVVVTPYYAADRALVQSAQARDELLANMLGQEAVEDVRSIRDGNYLVLAHTGTGTDWMAGLDGTPNCFYPNACVIGTDPVSGNVTVQQCPTNGAGCSSLPLYIGSASSSLPYFYNQSSQGAASSYLRSIQLYCTSQGTNQSGCVPSAATEVEAVASVQWTSHLSGVTTSSIQVNDFLDNWLSP